MEIFTKQNKINDLIDANYHLLPVINRFGINLGNKEKTLEIICLENDINTDFFLAIINTFHNEGYFPESELKSFSPIQLIEYLKKTHKHYINFVLPKIEKLLNKLIASNKTEVHQLDIIEQFYNRYKQELLLHISEEENELFPYVMNLIDKKENSEYPVHPFNKEHSNVDFKLNDLKNLVIKYLDPVYDNNICNEFLITLYRFEKDIIDHTRIEDKILIPMVLELKDELDG